MMLCEVCYDEVYNEKLPDARNFIADHEALFDTICMGCTDINRPLIDDMLGSSE
jgi:spermidine synthase